LPARYEPSGEDFLSPCLGEADVMRRVLSAEAGQASLEFVVKIPNEPTGDSFCESTRPHHIGFNQDRRKKIFAGRLVSERAIFVGQEEFSR